MAIQIQLRSDTAANWTSADPTLAHGEFAYESDTGKFKVGDGTTSWTGLSYAVAGPEGPPGPDGAPGPQGDPGADGAPGSDATVNEANVTAVLSAADAASSPADTDEMPLLQGGVLKRTLFSSIWTWIVSKIGAITSITAGGAWSFASSSRPKSSGTGEPTITDLVTANDSWSERVIGTLTHWPLFGTVGHMTAGGNSGTGSVGLASAGEASCGTTATGYGRILISSAIFGENYSWAGSIAPCVTPIILAMRLVNGNIVANSNGAKNRIVMGEVGSGAPINAATDPLTARGWGVEFGWSAANSRAEMRAFTHNGASISYSSWVAFNAPNSSNQPTHSLILQYDGAGTLKVFGTSMTSVGAPSRPALLITHSGGPTSGSYPTRYLSLLSVTDGTNAPTTPPVIAITGGSITIGRLITTIP